MELKTRPRADGFAVDVLDVDLSRDLDATTFAALRQTWMRNKVAVLRGQRLDDAALLRFSRRFGELFVHVRAQFHSPDHPEVMLISNLEAHGRPVGALGHEGLAWHSDQAYTARRVFGTLLYAEEIPDAGGNTLFADLTRAYAGLPEARQRALAPLETVFSIEVTTQTQNLPLPAEQRAATPDVVHPLVRTHPYLGTKGLYLSPAHTARFKGLEAAESAALLAELTAWASRPEFVYEHEWQPGDVVFWDNTQTMHTRRPFDRAARRLLRRTGWYLPDEAAA